MSKYNSANIYIVPNESVCNPPSPKRPKQELPEQDKSPQSVDCSFLDEIDIDAIVTYLNECDDVAKTMENMENENNEFEREKAQCHDESGLTEDMEIKTENTHADTIKDNNVVDHKERESPQTNLSKDNLVSSPTVTEPNNITSTINTNIISTDKIKCNNFKESLQKEKEHIVSKTNLVSISLNGNNNNMKENINIVDCKNNTTKVLEKYGHKDSKEIIDPKNNEKKAQRADKRELEIFAFNLEKRFPLYLNKACSVISQIHSGRFSDIFKCMDSDGKHYAVKIKNKGVGFKQQKLLKIIQHDIPKDNLMCVDLIAGFCFNNKWCFLMDFYPKNLREVIDESEKNLHIDTIQELAHHMVTGLATLKNKNIVHSDIQPSHILLDPTNSKLKICGFDEAYSLGTGAVWPFLGSKCYRAPEILLGYSAGFGVDVWSTALVFHEMATGRQLFGGCIDAHVLNKQICILGNVPFQILQQSRYRYEYNLGYCVQKYKCGTHNQKFGVRGKNIIASTIHGAYFKHWSNGRNEQQKKKDLKKISQFLKLLSQMLVISPELRLPIEFVYSNPFCYEFVTC